MWAQDFFEPGYTSIPGPNGPIALRVMIRSAHEERVAGRQVCAQLRSDTVGAIQYLAAGGSQDVGGNLEAIPPYAYDEKTSGRVIMGSINGSKPYMMEFLEAQETQAPIELDTTWLPVGHVDEFIQFLPADNRLGWVMAPILAPKNAADPTVCESKDIDEMLDHTNLVKVNTYCAEQIEANIKITRGEINLTDEEIIRIPAVYDDGALECWETQPARNSSEESLQDHLQPAANAAGKLRRRDRDTDIAAVGFYPGIVNGVPLSDTVYLAPNPWGPVINGRDIIADAVTAAYAKANYTVNYWRIGSPII
ncbi:Protein-arginine deiminase type-1 [Fusarium sp. LHS14.1]|nr:Protein-arginine deiminase type-1 [Fusarium sp. LHS14.1]